MQSRPLAVEGAYEFQPKTYHDERGLFVSPFQEHGFVDRMGHRLFPVAQTNHSRSRRGVIRGVHFTVTPPGIAKYVYCARGEALDIVVDIRVGSPTYGRWDAVLLDQRDFRAMYFPVGVGHAFVALRDDTVMSYMLSGGYVRENELALSVFDPALGLPIPDDIEPVLSERDRAAPTLAEARAAGVLPTYADSVRREEALHAAGQPARRP
ncbi:dTDP-4-dehydrorhamnose 3,5-epimerase family protein [Marinitenerispora sediminis]|uniref:dTDP-4-dehydrorhamnose 3,5-epimerase n=1 Tax=Marinitenerispora sediminis TaxID=1931232 RepID=A0A368SY86_9ACTN|nr:dTDP-4-dehydrorhamnose 3,5-epimerase family protein [Marinitenerispora sediminis]RCV47601.1 dTDP-4-dehydrorhamnose 3,5-epimerase [Marinitenerispora sediminis]RCV48078.1 dTDP-4-dehydrorhamnose 3,5-epimerase [Marinitenerispora sediminis]RCV48921.1 dTDP-4-dehydrorhamnose 3,5-epimerase [Marinitenerispora sediminis]